MCREHEATSFMVTVALLATVLHRWSGQDDLVLGVAVNTRRDAGVDALLGLFVNTVAVRVDLSGRPTFEELLRRVRRASVDDCVTHGETQLGVLLRELPVVRDPARTPLFQTLVSMIDTAESRFALPGIEIVNVEPPPQPGKVDLNLNVHDGDGGTRLELLYHADRYDAATMRAFLDQIAALLPAVAADPARDILEYELSYPPTEVPPPAAAAAPADWAVGRFQLTDEDRLAFLSGPPGSLASAVSTAAAAGAVLHRPAEDGPAALLDWLRATAVTAVYLTPPHLRALAARRGEPALTRLRLAFVTHRGDLTAHDAERLRQLAPGCHVVGVYVGQPTGNPLAAYVVPARWSASTAPPRLPIGTELGGPGVVRNRAGRPAATGEVGESTVAGRRPVSWSGGGPTACSSAPAAGRRPRRTRIRWRRCAPCATFRTCTTRWWSARGSRTSPVSAPRWTSRLREHLVTRLPEYLIPQRVVVLDRFPLTLDGEYDLESLPEAHPTEMSDQP